MSPLSGCLSSIIQIILLLSVFYLVRSPLTYMKKLDNKVIEDYKTQLSITTNYPEVQIIKEKGADSYIHLLPSSSMNDVLSNISVVPTTLFVNNKGEIIKSVLGSNTFKRWQEIISEL